MRWRIWALTLAVGLLSLWLVWAQSEKRVTIELKDAPIADAFDQLFRAAGENFILQPGVPKEYRLTMRLADVPFEKALNFLCDLTGLRWEQKDGIYVINAKPPKSIEATGGVIALPQIGVYDVPPTPPPIALGGPAIAMPSIPLPSEIAPPVAGIPKASLPFNICTRCRQIVTRQCPKCKRPMEFFWNFCPYDGVKLPPAPEKCPKCGEQLLKTPEKNKEREERPKE